MQVAYDELCQILRDCHRRFRYIGDMQQFKKPEHWPAYSEIPDEGTFADDCDGFAQMVRKELHKRGEWSTLALCGVNSQKINHCVAVYNDWVMDNIHRWPMKKSDLATYKFIEMMDSMGDWRVIVNG